MSPAERTRRVARLGELAGEASASRSRSASASTPSPRSGNASAAGARSTGSTEPLPPLAAAPKTRRRPATVPAGRVIKDLVGLASQRWQPRSSIKLSTGPRAQVMVDLTVHAGDAPGVETLDELIAYATARFDALRAVYGAPVAAAGNGEE